MSERESTQSQTMGNKKYREMIHKDTKRIDNTSKLPFSFSKPQKSKPLNTAFLCENCGHTAAVTEETLLVICSGCKHINRVKSIKKKGL